MESHILPCPVCGVGINASLSVCPVCKSETHFQDNDSNNPVRKCAYCGEEIPAKAAFCPACGKPTNVQTAATTAGTIAAIPPQTPAQPASQQQQYTPYQTQQQKQEAPKSKMTPIIVGLLATLAIAIIVMLIITLTSQGGKSESEPESVSTNLVMEQTLDSIRRTLPVAAEEVIRYTDDMPSLFYLYENKLHRVDANTLDDETIDFTESNSKAKIDYRNGGIIEAKPTKDDRYLFIHANAPGEEQNEVLLRYDVKTGKTHVLGHGYAITDNGSGYLIKSPNSEKKIDAYGNIVGDRDPGLSEDEPQEENKPVDQPRQSKPAKPRVEETPQTEVITVQPEPQKPADPPIENKGSGFHLEEI